MISAVTHMPIANWAALTRSAKSEIGTEIAPAARVANTIAGYGLMPSPAKNTVP